MKTINIPKEIISETKRTNNIVNLIEEAGVVLKKSGPNLIGCCPFHQETEPSFNVNESKQVFNCFGCSAHGDIIGFVMQHKKIDFLEAVKFLRYRAGLPEIEIGTEAEQLTINNEQLTIEKQANEPMKQTPEPEKKELTEAERITLLNRVVKFYHKKFLENEKAQNYLFLTRKIKNKNLANAYKIGFCDGSLMKTLENQPEYKEKLLLLGVIKQNEKTKQYFEAFKNCVVFPIFDEENNCVNLYGRKIDTAQSENAGQRAKGEGRRAKRKSKTVNWHKTLVFVRRQQRRI